MNSIVKPAIKTVLTGDRPTGPLHLGHYVGSLKNRITLQKDHTQFIMIADAQALTDNFDNPEKVRSNILEVALDYLAVGINPAQSTIFVQSQIPELTELCFYYLNLVTVSRLERNPTIKEEIKQHNFERDIPAGFLTYPVSQAADISAFKANIVPVGDDQIPMIEQTNEIVRHVNRIAKRPVLVEAQAMISTIGRLPGIDGKAKMSKSLGNTINLNSSADEISRAIKKMYTDPLHIAVNDPGRIEGNVVFSYLDAFHPDAALVAELKAHYQRGGLGDSVVKKHLEEVLQEFLRPIREQRALLAQDPENVRNILRAGSVAARQVAAATLDEVKDVFGLGRF